MTQPDSASKLADLRREMAAAGYDGFLVPMVDEFQSEYVPDSARRIAFLSNFSGSAGYIIVLKDKAAFFTDSRYTLQASQQVPEDLFAIFDSAEKTPITWLEENTFKGMEIAYDPWLHSADGVEAYQKILSKNGVGLVAVERNLVDLVWPNKPADPAKPAFAYEQSYAGKISADKRLAITEILKKKNVGAVVITDPASVAWLLNVRGGDVQNTPLPLSRVILLDDGTAQWFIDPRKVVDNTLAHHVGDAVTIKAPDQFAAALKALAQQEKPILLDTAHAASWIVDYLRKAGAKIEKGDDPCELPKACKNAIELDGMRAAHRRDGASLVKFLSWLDQHWTDGNVTEMTVEHKLAGYREANNNYREPSFDTIAGVGEHGAIVHYRATTTSDTKLQTGQLLLLDSGAQYLDGTTDVTRTLALGIPSNEMRDRFTRVLKGHIGLASIKFPPGTTGSELDVLARQHLWEVGLDYGHGTGHGVGTYLGVHEGPQSISRRSKVVLQPGMVVSNEPGYYKTGHYGIRIENLQVVVDIVGMGESDRKFLGFETLTLAPIDRKLIDVSMLTNNEITWLNAYHLRVRQVLRPMLDEPTAIWLDAATLPIER